MDEEKEEKYYYSLNTTEVLLSDIRKHVESTSNNDSKIVFLSTPSLFFSCTTSEELKKRSILFDETIYAPETIKGLSVEHYYYTNYMDVPKKYHGSACFVVCEPTFITEEVIEKYLETTKILAGDDCRIIFCTILENGEILSNFGCQPVKFLPSIPHLVYQYTIFSNFSSTELDKENNEILKDEEKSLQFTDEKKYKLIKKQKVREIKEIRKVVNKHRVKFPNAKFYMNKIPSLPHGDYVENIHKKWFGNYNLLEMHHGYIQWLFPYKSSGGMNYYSEGLQQEEIEMFLKDEKMQERFVLSYRLILDFYGIKLVDEKTGAVEREKNWEERANSFTFHNNLRITRILKCMQNLEFPSHYRKPLVEFFVNEILGNYNMASSFNSLMHFWIMTLEPEDQVKMKENIEETGILKKFLKKHSLIKRQYMKRTNFLKRGGKGFEGGDVSKDFHDGLKNKRQNFRKFRKKKKKKDPFDDFLVM